jgi:hypothetical protein
MSRRPWSITTSPDELRQGLFGQIVLWVFELLPYLHARGIFPLWDIKSRLYGTEPDYTVIPGVFDLAYSPSEGPCAEVRLATLRDAHASVLGGGDWDYLTGLWHSYFRIPGRTQSAATQIALPPNTLGIHYRGNDKNRKSWDTNPVSPDDFLTLAANFLGTHPDVTTIFVATDEFSFVAKARRALSPLPIINLGEVGFHKASQNIAHKGDRALLDCVVLSRCTYVLKCSSALSGFAKVLNRKYSRFPV